jgi:hypothetical protein
MKHSETRMDQDVTSLEKDGKVYNSVASVSINKNSTCVSRLYALTIALLIYKCLRIVLHRHVSGR